MMDNLRPPVHGETQNLHPMSNIWRTPKEAFNPQCTWPAVKHSKASADGMAMPWSHGQMIGLCGHIIAVEYEAILQAQTHHGSL